MVAKAWSLVVSLRSDYDLLGEKLAEADGSGAAAIVRERRILAEQLERLEAQEAVPKVDEVAAQRSKSGVVRPPARRRKSG